MSNPVGVGEARTGEIPHVQLGRYRRFRESPIEEWLSELEALSTASHLPSPAATDPTDQAGRRNGSRSGAVQSARRQRP